MNEIHESSPCRFRGRSSSARPLPRGASGERVPDSHRGDDDSVDRRNGISGFEAEVGVSSPGHPPSGRPGRKVRYFRREHPDVATGRREASRRREDVPAFAVPAARAGRDRPRRRPCSRRRVSRIERGQNMGCKPRVVPPPRVTLDCLRCRFSLPDASAACCSTSSTRRCRAGATRLITTRDVIGAAPRKALLHGVEHRDTLPDAI